MIIRLKSLHTIRTDLKIFFSYADLSFFSYGGYKPSLANKSNKIQ